MCPVDDFSLVAETRYICCRHYYQCTNETRFGKLSLFQGSDGQSPIKTFYLIKQGEHYANMSSEF